MAGAYDSFMIAQMLCVIFLGLCLGSFATALAWRLPRELPWVRTRSVCTSCGHPLSWLDLFPVLSWLALRGRCRYCGVRIDGRYPAIELATVCVCGIFYWRYGLSWGVLPLYALAPVLLAATDIDFRFKIIPDILNGAVFLTAIVLLTVQAVQLGLGTEMLLFWVKEAALGGLIYGGGSYLLRQIFLWKMRREALGLGDVKFFAAAGVWLGTDAMTMAYFLFFSGAAGVLLALVWRRFKREAAFPFGPALFLSFLCVLLWRGSYFLT